MTKIRTICFVYLSLILFGFFVTQAHALSLSPARVELSGDPGQTIEGEFQVVNDQSKSQTFYTSAESFEAKGDDGTPNFFKSTDGIDSWVRVEPSITFKGSEQKKIQFRITIPKKTEAGGYFGAIFLSTNPPAQSGQVVVSAKIGVLLLLHVSGTIKEGGGLLEYKTTDNTHFFSSLPISFEYRFQNSGSDRVKPTGTIQVKNIFGFTRDEINANRTDGNVLPGSVRKFAVLWSPDESIPTSFIGTVLYQAKHFAVGIYTATLTLQYGSTGAEVAKAVRLFIFPWQLLVVASVLSVFLFLLSRTLIRKYNAWIIKHAIQIHDTHHN